MSIRPAPHMTAGHSGFIIDLEHPGSGHMAALQRGVVFFSVLAALMLVILCV